LGCKKEKGGHKKKGNVQAGPNGGVVITKRNGKVGINKTVSKSSTKRRKREKTDGKGEKAKGSLLRVYHQLGGKSSLPSCGHKVAAKHLTSGREKRKKGEGCILAGKERRGGGIAILQVQDKCACMTGGPWAF